MVRREEWSCNVTGVASLYFYKRNDLFVNQFGSNYYLYMCDNQVGKYFIDRASLDLYIFSLLFVQSHPSSDKYYEYKSTQCDTSLCR